MSRSGYYECDGEDSILVHGRWRGQVASAIRGNRGQKFLKELAQAMDAMPEKELTRGSLVTPQGECCTMGVICKARGINVNDIDDFDPEEVGDLLGIAQQLAAEIAFVNDDLDWNFTHHRQETTKERWVRMRKWVGEKLHR